MVVSLLQLKNKERREEGTRAPRTEKNRLRLGRRRLGKLTTRVARKEVSTETKTKQKRPFENRKWPATALKSDSVFTFQKQTECIKPPRGCFFLVFLFHFTGQFIVFSFFRENLSPLELAHGFFIYFFISPGIMCLRCY